MLWRRDADGSAPKRPNPSVVRIALIAALLVLAIQGAIAVAVLATQRDTPPAAKAAARSGGSKVDVACEGVTLHYGIHGTDCKSLPIVTAPGALGPANTGGPGGGTDWTQAYPGSTVWIPDYQISGRLLVLPAGSPKPPPEGYEKIGRTLDGATLYWRTDDSPE